MTDAIEETKKHLRNWAVTALVALVIGCFFGYLVMTEMLASLVLRTERPFAGGLEIILAGGGLTFAIVGVIQIVVDSIKLFRISKSPSQ